MTKSKKPAPVKTDATHADKVAAYRQATKIDQWGNIWQAWFENRVPILPGDVFTYTSKQGKEISGEVCESIGKQPTTVRLRNPVTKFEWAVNAHTLNVYWRNMTKIAKRQNLRK